MTISLEISQNIDVRIDWEKLVKELKEKFNIEASEEEIEKFCCGNEFKYLNVEILENEMEEEHTNDITGDVTLRMDLDGLMELRK